MSEAVWIEQANPETGNNTYINPKFLESVNSGEAITEVNTAMAHIPTAEETAEVNAQLLKDKAKQYLKDTKPDIVVLGKKKRKILKPIGDNFTSFMLKQYKGAILIADFKNSFEPNNELSLGLFNYEQLPTSISFLPELMAHIKKPLKSFKMGNNLEHSKDPQITPIDTVDFVFDACENVPETLSKYVAINEVNLLCIERPSKAKKSTTLQANLKDIINTINVPLLITESKELHLT